MTHLRRPSAQTTAVVLALAEQPTIWRHGNELSRQPDLTPGSLYRILMWLADRGLLETTWDTDVPAGPHGSADRVWPGAGGRPCRGASSTAGPEGEVAGRVSQTPRRLLIVTAGAVVAAWAVLYLVVITTAPLSYDPATESAEAVKSGETPGGHLVCMSASGVGWLIQATAGSLGGVGGRANRWGLAA
jgi:hypothetical protein